MTLNFSTTLKDGQLAYFPEKILSNLDRTKSLRKTEGNLQAKFREKGYEFDLNSLPYIENRKLHTIRADKNKQWKAGNKIEFTINHQTENEFQFAEAECISVQKIEISYKYDEPYISIDEVSLTALQKRILALNDGFESLEAFFAYFDTDFEGKIIHWTDLSY
jgi:hypothetical protein